MLSKVVERRNLTVGEAYDVFLSLIGESQTKVAAYLAAIQTKGFTAEELAGFAKAMRDSAIRVDLGEVCDTCGTGGDNSNTINVSTASAIIVSCFKNVAKHGNVSVTSKSGSANLLSEMGIDYQLYPDKARYLLEKTGFTFLFAPIYHPTLKRIMPVRKELGIRTIFNVLGPLANPANPDYQVIGVYSEDLLEKVANAISLLGVKRGIVVHGRGLDEVTPKGTTKVVDVRGDDIETYSISPQDFGLSESRVIPCKSAKESAERIINVFRGHGITEDRHFITLNAAVVLYALDMGDLRECRELVDLALEERVMGKVEEIRHALSKA